MRLSLGYSRRLDLLSLRAIFLLLVVTLSACSTSSISESTPSSTNSLAPTSQPSPMISSPVSEHAKPSDSQIGQEIIPPPPQTPVALGQPARVGTFTIVVHGRQWVDWRELVPGELDTYRQTKRLLVDLSLRNDMQRVVPWPLNATFTILSADGTALNAEYNDIQMGFNEGAIGLLPPELQTDECAKRVSDILRPVSYLKRMLPSEVTRRWLSYQQTPGFEQEDLQLEVVVPGIELNEQSYTARFLLKGTPNPSPLPMSTVALAPEGQLAALVIKDAQIGPAVEIQDDTQRSIGTHVHFEVRNQYGPRLSDWRFRNSIPSINQPPRIPSQTAPGPNSALGNRTVTLQWQDAGDPDNSPRTYRDYYAEIWKTDNSWRQALSWTSATNWTITVPSDGQYAWRVKAGDGALGSDWSSTWNFHVDTNRPPNTPQQMSPADSSYVNSRSIALQWQDAGDPDNGPRTYRDYYAEIWKTDNSWHQTLSWTTVTSWSVMVPSDGTYQWRVRAGDGAAGSNWAGPWQVVIDTVAPSGIVTINNGVETSDTVYVPIMLHAKDIGSRIGQVRLSNDGIFWGTWQPMVNQVWQRLDGEHSGTATVYVQYRDAAGNISSSISDSIGLNFYPSQPASSRYQVAQDIVAMNGGVQQSAQHRMNGTSGQSLASEDAATSSRYQVTLGYWNGYTSNH